MTSDAKIGLLLGLVFIFVIAFVINGLPSFRDATNNSELTTNMVSSQKDSWGIGTNERKIQEGIDWTGQPFEEPVEEPFEEITPEPENTEDIRFEMSIPENIAIVEDTSTGLTPEMVEQTLAQSNDPLVGEPPAPEPTESEVVETIAIELPPVERPPEPDNRAGARRSAPKVYVVSDGDNLGSIARRFYGPEEGNRWVNSLKIFEANRGVLESPHKLVIGQKIVVPPLKASKPNSDKPKTGLAGSFFEQAKSIGRKLLPAADKPKPAPKPAPKPNPGRHYVVQSDDSLWQIATKQLGDPIRYKEIVKLNPGVLRNENTTLKIGMQLNLPAQ